MDGMGDQVDSLGCLFPASEIQISCKRVFYGHREHRVVSMRRTTAKALFGQLKSFGINTTREVCVPGAG